jgi:C4-dicarboxylate-specific signal transduction histidine kinase
VELCLSELQRLDDVVRTVLEVGRTNRPATGRCNAHQVVEETVLMMKRKAAERGVRVSVQVDAAESGVGMDSAALRGLLLNLMLNSMDALEGQPAPRIHIHTQVLDVPAGESSFELRVSDNGPGVPAHIRERIFDPFFTTKPSGNGIGLPTAMRAVQECGGVLRYEAGAEWGGGAQFVVELPLAESAIAPSQRPGRERRSLVTAGA